MFLLLCFHIFLLVFLLILHILIHNRDKNAMQNMLNIVKEIFNTGKRPEAFCRVVNS